MLNFGQHPRLGMRISNESYYVPEAKEFAKKMQEAVLDAKECMRRAQDRQRTYANQKRRELQFKVGDKVLLSTKNIRFRSKGTKKLLPKFIGPFTVVKKVGKPSQEVAYQLDLPEKYKIHNVFHVSLLKPYHEDSRNVQVQPPEPELVDGELYYQVERILDHQTVQLPGKRKGRTIKKYLVSWKGYPPSDNSFGNQRSVLTVVQNYSKSIGIL